MATFQYRAYDRKGRQLKGTIAAASAKHARERLRFQELRVDSVRERKPNALRHTWTTRSRRGKHRSQLTAFTREAATLLQAGVPLLETLDSIIPDSQKGFHETLLAVRDKLENGEGLAEAMTGHPDVFDDMTVGMIRVGEHSGNLPEIFEQVAEFRERGDELKDRVLSAILYPAIILFVSVGVAVFLMAVVVPMLLQNMVELGRPLPLPTLVLKFASDLILDHGLLLLLFAFVCVCVAAIVLSSVSGRLKVNAIMLRIPILGTLVQKQALSRMSLILSTLLRSGLELVDALAIAGESTPNPLLKAALTELQEDLRNGRDLRTATDKHDIFTNAASQVFHLGQQSGQLEKMLERLGRDYDRQTALLANRLTTIAEPALIIALSVFIGFILFATILPILEAGNVLSG
ncbi:type II secretion system F family protein [Roseiconus lacunae]|uniref:type II secretion system F family protein n=1 Tax=Roseiconus lacunae TaxID=2605694 RepID=UPI001E346ECF|nr:type II secretion system F family protein [Roseiconus lacunae]MCD0459991.1 type II secretion system F family protein [Roseiconus lacunae]